MERKHNFFITLTDNKNYQPTIESFQVKKSIPLTKKQKENIDKLLALSIATTTASYNFVESKYFKLAISSINSNYDAPSRYKISRIISNESAEIVERIKSIISDSKSISMCLDFWSDKKLNGYLGANIATMINDERKVYFISLRYVPHPHLAAVVLQETNKLLFEFNLNGIDDRKQACQVKNGN